MRKLTVIGLIKIKKKRKLLSQRRFRRKVCVFRSETRPSHAAKVSRNFETGCGSILIKQGVSEFRKRRKIYIYTLYTSSNLSVVVCVSVFRRAAPALLMFVL